MIGGSQEAARASATTLAALARVSRPCPSHDDFPEHEKRLEKSRSFLSGDRRSTGKLSGLSRHEKRLEKSKRFLSGDRRSTGTIDEAYC